jgi:hypothetical protein
MSNQQAFYSLIIREQCNPLPISAVTAYLVAISSFVSALDHLKKKMFVTAITANVTTGTGTEESQ